MKAVFLVVHVLAAIVLIGPLTVAASLFPRYAREALASGDAGAAGAVRAMHRITTVYAVAGIAVPVFGVVTALAMGVLTDFWVLVSIALTILGAGILAAFVLPAQFEVVEALGVTYPDPEDERQTRATASARRLSMTTGLFALTWAVVVVLMIVRPGSTTGV